MTQDCLNTYIRDTKCKYYKEVEKLSDALAYGKRDLKCVFTRVKLLRMYIRLMCEYDAFDEEVTAAFSIEFVNAGGSSDTITLTLDGDPVYTYVGTGTGEDIASFFYGEITTGPSDYIALFDGNTLYIYTYSVAISYLDLPLTTSSGGFTTFTTTSLENSLDTILDLLNCITEEQLESIIRHSQKILINHTTTSNCGCGC